MVLPLAQNRHWINILLLLLSPMQILVSLCVSRTGLPCLPPTNPSVTLKAARSALSLENNINWLTYFFHTNSMISKHLEKPEPKQIPFPRQPHTNFLNLGNQTRERERAKRKSPAFHCFTSYISSSFHKHKVHSQKCLGQSLYLLEF